jgi:hypothetical protein
LKNSNYSPYTEIPSLLPNGAGLQRNAADGLFTRPSKLGFSEKKGEKEIEKRIQCVRIIRNWRQRLSRNSFDNWVDRYLNHLVVEKGLSRNTIEAYASDLQGFSSFLGERDGSKPQLVTPEKVINYFKTLRTRGRSPRSYAPGRGRGRESSASPADAEGHA